jgi:hypothetical protein
MEQTMKLTPYPQGLLDWAGHRGGGVRKLFFQQSGRPSKSTIRTRLIERLEEWADSLGEAEDLKTPRVVLLVGGPGNGKTESVEFAIGRLDYAFHVDGSLIAELSAQFLPSAGTAPPRLARAKVRNVGSGDTRFIQIVQDASAGDYLRPDLSPAQLLIEELDFLLKGKDKVIHLACVNRGVLDEALVVASDTDQTDVQTLISQVVHCVGMGPQPISCWPLAGYPEFAVWPMDIESLLKPSANADVTMTPAAELLSSATAEEKWPAFGECAAGERCPFCLNRQMLSSEPARSSFLNILRWYELASGKRWSFRDLASLYSYLLAGAPLEGTDQGKYSPCEWAARQAALRTGIATGRARSMTPYSLASRIYRHSLFSVWPRLNVREFKGMLRDLDLLEDEVLSGLLYFLNDSRRLAIPPTLAIQLEEISEALDPAIADPDSPVELSGSATAFYREIDARFSQSVEEGLAHVKQRRSLTVPELELLKDLSDADKRIAKAGRLRNRVTAAAGLQTIVRDFACRLVRRGLGTRCGAIKDSVPLMAFEKIVAGDDDLLHDAAVEIESLLNKGERFAVVLNTTFGEPLPAPERRVTLTTARQRVRVPTDVIAERPAPAVRFLTVGSVAKPQFVPLTYELYRSVVELKKGMLEASLPKPVIALLDITRAKLGGAIVRDKDALELGNIQIGLRREAIVYQRGRFIVRQGGNS